MCLYGTISIIRSTIVPMPSLFNFIKHCHRKRCCVSVVVVVSVCVCVCVCVCMCVCLYMPEPLLKCTLSMWKMYVEVWITVSISMYVMCVTFVQCFEPQGRHFTNCHYYYKQCWSFEIVSISFSFDTRVCTLIISISLPVQIHQLAGIIYNEGYRQKG